MLINLIRCGVRFNLFFPGGMRTEVAWQGCLFPLNSISDLLNISLYQVETQLSPGIYFFQIINENKLAESGKLIVWD